MTCECDQQLAFTLSELAKSMSEQFVTNADGSGFDHAKKCHAVSGGKNDDMYGAPQIFTNDTNSGSYFGPIDPVAIGSASDNGERQCCGTYPARFEFSTHGGSRACCGENTYDTYKLQCCEGDFVSQIGSCATER